MATDPVADLSLALDLLRAGLAAGRSPYSLADEFFEAAAVPVSRLRSSGALSGQPQERTVEAVDALLDCGRTLFQSDREAAIKLGQILSWARHLAGALPADPKRDEMLDNFNRDWHWRTLG